jgi:hypothetical protein
MDGMHLRLEAVRIGGTSSGSHVGLDGIVPRRAAMAVMLDRRVAALGEAATAAAALLGFALLPWCDVTLWSVLEPGAGIPDLRTGGGGAEPTLAEGCAHAWMRVELAHVDWALAYVERLPVQQSLVSKAWRWRWSSAPWHCGFGSRPRCLAPEWTGPLRRDLWRERLAGMFVGRSDRSVPLAEPERHPHHAPPDIAGSAIDVLVRRAVGHSPGMPSGRAGEAGAMEPSQGELAVA